MSRGSTRIKLPSHYRRFLIDHGKTIAPFEKSGSFVPFFAAAKEIIDANKELRANPSLRDTIRDTEPWPLKYLIVGTSAKKELRLLTRGGMGVSRLQTKKHAKMDVL